MIELNVEHWPIARLKPYARNPRVNDHAVDQMAAVISEFGFRIPVVAKSSGELVDGHLRLKAAHKLGLKTVPVALADDLNDAQIKAFRLAVNKAAEWAEWDQDLLNQEISALAELEFDMEKFGFDLQEVEEIENEYEYEEEEGEARPSEQKKEEAMTFPIVLSFKPSDYKAWKARAKELKINDTQLALELMK